MARYANAGKIRGGIKSGYAAHRNKTGIHGLSSEQKQQASIKGKDAFLEKMKNPEFRQLHRDKIRLGKLISRFNRLPKPFFGFV
jgi:hypothetical protein